MPTSRIIVTVFIMLCFICIPVDAQHARNSFSEVGNKLSERSSNSANKTIDIDKDTVTDNTIGLLYGSNKLNTRSLSSNSINLIYTIAGTGINGYNGDNGQATSAEIASPRGIAVDSSGNTHLQYLFYSC